MIAVVGAGLGGLAAAVTLARAGQPVVVFERHSEPGGFATHFKRGPYTFDASLHALDAMGPGEAGARLLERLGVLDRLDLRSAARPRRVVWPERGLDLTLPHGPEGWLEVLGDRFPASAPGMKRIFALAERVHRAAFAWMESGDERPGPEAMALTQKTVAQVLGEHVPDPEVVALLSTLTTWLGLGPDRLGAMSYLLILHGYLVLQAAYPVGGSRALTDALVAELESRGGRLVLGAPVEEIISHRRRVRAVRAQGEHPVSAVIAACSPLLTFERLLSEADRPPRLLAQLRGMELSGSMLSLHLGVRDVAGLPPHPYEAVLRGLDHPALPATRISLGARHLLDPSAAPPGHGVFEISTAAPTQDGPGLVHTGARDALLSLADTFLLPGLKDRVEVEALAHPGTFLRYTDSPRGATYGFAMTPAQSGARGLAARTPIDGLYQAGAWIRPGAGQTAALISGWQAARTLLQELR